MTENPDHAEQVIDKSSGQRFTRGHGLLEPFLVSSLKIESYSLSSVAFPQEGRPWGSDSKWTKNNVKQCGIGLSQRAKAFAMEFPFDVIATPPSTTCRPVSRHRFVRCEDGLRYCGHRNPGSCAKIANRLIPQELRLGGILDIGCGTFPYFLARTEFEKKFAIDQLPIPSQIGHPDVIEQTVYSLSQARYDVGKRERSSLDPTTR
jgi:hypothetical protein